MRRRWIGRLEGDRLPAPPQVFASRRPPASLSVEQARALVDAARPLSDLHALFWDRGVTLPASDKRGVYRRRGGR